MEGLYITNKGEEVKIITFDAPNNMIFVSYPDGEKKWVGKVDYDKWSPKYISIPDIPSQMFDPENIEKNAIQKSSTSSLFQHSQETIGEKRSECEGVESSIKGDESSTKSETQVREKRKYIKK